eukprot:991802-Amphidinium_carterae.1
MGPTCSGCSSNTVRYWHRSLQEIFFSELLFVKQARAMNLMSLTFGSRGGIGLACPALMGGLLALSANSPIA